MCSAICWCYVRCHVAFFFSMCHAKDTFSLMDPAAPPMGLCICDDNLTSCRLMISPGKNAKFPPGSLGYFAAWAHQKASSIQGIRGWKAQTVSLGRNFFLSNSIHACSIDVCSGFPWLWSANGSSSPMGNVAAPLSEPKTGGKCSAFIEA